MIAHLFALALFLTQILIFFSASAFTNISTDQSALLAIKSRLSLDPSHILSNNWSASTSVCDWIGVTCGSRHQRVTALDISSMGLVGNLPPETGNLSFLVSFNLSRNYFSGNLPAEMSRLLRLQVIDFYINDFTGEFPSWFQFLAQLKVLNLRNNSFTGPLPNSIANISKLETLDLMYNSMHGEIPRGMGNVDSLKKLSLQFNQFSGLIPTELFNISSLEILALSKNSFSGGLPADMCVGNPRLERLQLSYNELGGQIPWTISRCSRLRIISLSFNKFNGPIPREIGNLSALEILFLGTNNITGEIPRSIGNLTMMTQLGLGHSNLIGNVPEEIGHLMKLDFLYLGYSRLSGLLPEIIFNISTLQMISMSRNHLSGILPKFLGYGLPNLQELYLGNNNFAGQIPESISNATGLAIIYFNYNSFSGYIPHSLGELRFLKRLHLVGNKFISESRELGFVTSLTKWKNLQSLELGDNQTLNGTLPITIGNLSSSLQYLHIEGMGIFGRIPNEICNLSSLIFLNLDGNQLTGSFPHNLGNLYKLQELHFRDNKLSGILQNDICELPSLELLSLGRNKIEGSIPDCIGALTSLRHLNIDGNKLSYGVPTSLWQLNDLLELDLSSNFLTGSLPPDIANMKSLTSLDLSTNHFTNNIPNSIGNLQNLKNLSLANNRFTGTIPESMGTMVSLEYLDLSHNNLSGHIPISLPSLRYLSYLDVSFNDLSGQIPSNGSFKNFTSQFFASNEGLCGDPRYGVLPCEITNISGSRKWKIMIAIICVMLGAVLLASAIALTFIVGKYRRKNVPVAQTNVIETSPIRVSYYDIASSTKGFSESHLIGVGGFSSVYKGTLRDGKPVAIKVLDLNVEGAYTNFDTECELLSSLKHRNLCKIIGVCSNESFKGLVLEYMPNGSLDKWLYSEDCILDIMQRVSLMIDVACALEYLHHGYSISVVHRDLKPSNVLLDENMVARLSDFGISKLLNEGDDSFAQSKTLATFGYMAPEYGSDGLVSVKSDVYSYGIMLMEVFTRMRPSDETFVGDLSLNGLVHESWPNEIIRILDSRLFSHKDELFAGKLECLLSIMELALKCSTENPSQRISMNDVVVQLKKIHMKLLTNSQENRRESAVIRSS